MWTDHDLLAALRRGDDMAACQPGFRQRVGWKVALVRHADESIAQTQGIDDFGGARK